jgi:hypothetical protein
MTNIKKILLVATVFGLSNVVSAGTTTWQWDLQGTSGATTLNVVGTNTDDTTTLNGDLTAFADTGGPNDDILEQSTNLPQYGSGWGMKNQDGESGSPEHAFDNKTTEATSSCPNGYSYKQNTGKCHRSYSAPVDPIVTPVETDYDMALVSFDTSVELKEVGFSWTNNNTTDFTVLAYTGPSATPTLAGNTWAGIASDWTLVGSYRANNSNSNNAGYYGINASNVDSTHWLIGAFNDILDTGYHDGHDTDAFKLKGLTGKTSTEEVSEPAALGLMLLGLFSLYVRRNKAKA